MIAGAIVPRDPQSPQSVPVSQFEYSEPGPPSLQMPLLAHDGNPVVGLIGLPMHWSVHTSVMG